jgi:ectoine hydroxylase-related dioxygenase (phytanoyl-CoA dioxygenase family)
MTTQLSLRYEEINDMRMLYQSEGIVKLSNFTDIEPYLDVISKLADDVTINIPDTSRVAITVDKTFETVRVMSQKIDLETGIMTKCINEKRQLTRVENFVLSHNDWVDMCNKISDAVGLVCDSEVGSPRWPLYKEKLNLKPAGGSGYAPHLDTPSLRVVGLAQEFVTVMIAIDDMTPENGCLSVCKGQWTESNTVAMLCSPEQTSTSSSPDDEQNATTVAKSPVLNPDGNGRQGAITSAASKALKWENIECKAGDMFLFSGWLPHRSGGNATQGPRRAVYLTFNPPEDGEDLRELYYMLMKKMRADYEQYSRGGVAPSSCESTGCLG